MDASQTKTLLDKVSSLNDMILQGQGMPAFEKYYHEDVEMSENGIAPTTGKAANRVREEEFFGAITEFRGATVINVAIGEGMTMVEWHFDYTHKDWGVRNYKQVAVQEWKDDQIIKETFYYGA
jgi:hypothetical protein